MQFKNSKERFGAVAQFFHWTVVVLIISQIVLAKSAQYAPGLMQKAKLLTTHKSIGMTIFILALLRLSWRLANPTPLPLANVRPWQNRAASVVHWSLYVLIVVTPLAGWLMSSARNFSVSYFGWFTLPNLVAPDAELFQQLKLVHRILAYTITNLAILHMLAALKHHFIDGDNTLRRMLPIRLKNPNL